MGPSGSKTTLLNMMMNLEFPDKGSILGLENQKSVAVFQEDISCDMLSVKSNIKIVFTIQKTSQKI